MEKKDTWQADYHWLHDVVDTILPFYPGSRSLDEWPNEDPIGNWQKNNKKG